VKPHKQAALTKEPLQAVLATCDDSPRGKRDRALLLFGWASGGRRRSESAGAAMENLRKVGSRGYLCILAYSKTNQDGKVNPADDKPIAGIAAAALEQWLEVSGITEGPIFRRILKGGRILDEALDPTAIRKIVKQRCLQVGLVGDFSAHSLRAGLPAPLPYMR
jgi:integrase